MVRACTDHEPQIQSESWIVAPFLFYSFRLSPSRGFALWYKVSSEVVVYVDECRFSLHSVPILCSWAPNHIDLTDAEVALNVAW